MTFHQLLIYCIAPLAGYLLGSIPFAFVIGKLHGVDIRKVGSGNIGATNLGRALGKRYFWQAFILDAAKGFFPVFSTAMLVHIWKAGAGVWVPAWAPLLTAVACILGHLFPLFLNFKGGKGVATCFGTVLGFWPIFTLAGVGGGCVFVAVLMIYRIISLSSIVSSVAFVCFVVLLGSGSVIDYTSIPWKDLSPLVAVAALFSAMIIVRHRGNIVRLLQGTEPTIGKKQIDAAKMDRS